MLFNSFVFALFLPAVFGVYWLTARGKPRAQNLVLLLASYLFYGWWDVRFLGLIFLSSLGDFLFGLGLEKWRENRLRKRLLWGSIGLNLGILGFFKYYGFFVGSLAQTLEALGFSVHLGTLNIVLPVGISFYTFQTLSYTIDIYFRRMSASRDPLAFFAFVSFFPQLVAGPIERAKHLLPQFESKRIFRRDEAADGLRQTLWGLFKKVVVADNLAWVVDQVFTDYQRLDSFTLTAGVFFFAIQIYCDFSGYSDMAIGIARLFGIRLSRNFAFPYFSRDMAEFWRRWHISLSSWFRDYVYIPLGGSRASRSRVLVNIGITFTVSGLWHGANWTFLFWGALHGLYYIPLQFLSRHKTHQHVVARGKWLPSVRESAAMGLTFALTCFAWVFFRADSLDHAFGFFGHWMSMDWSPEHFYKKELLLSGVVLAVEWFQREKQHALAIENYPKGLRWMLYYLFIGLILLLGNMKHAPFIYFQF